MKLTHLICHQRSDRSFTIRDRQFPVCARCTGIYLGTLIGLFWDAFIVLWQINGYFPVIALTILYIPLAADGLIQLFGLKESNNKRRFFTGLLVGIGGGMTLRLGYWIFVVKQFSVF